MGRETGSLGAGRHMGLENLRMMGPLRCTAEGVGNCFYIPIFQVQTPWSTEEKEGTVQTKSFNHRVSALYSLPGVGTRTFLGFFASSFSYQGLPPCCSSVWNAFHAPFTTKPPTIRSSSLNCHFLNESFLDPPQCQKCPQTSGFLLGSTQGLVIIKHLIFVSSRRSHLPWK